jgi:pimeloyl-ACP methyl ester carboxylesterase
VGAAACPAHGALSHVIAPDLYYPGKWGDFTVAQAADDVLGLVAELVEWPVVLVGMSLGSAVAMQIAVNAPERVSGMVLGAPRVRVPNGAMRTNRLIMQLLPRKNGRAQPCSQLIAAPTDDLSEEAEQRTCIASGGLGCWRPHEQWKASTSPTPCQT